MAAKRILAAILTVIILVAVSSCGGQNRSETSGPLRICMSDYDIYLQNSIGAFNKTQGKTLIEADIFHYDQSEEYAERLKAELASGKGPDIIAVPNYTLFDFSKLISSGYLYDLNKLMENDPEFKTGDYFEPVLDAGLVNNGRYFIPYSFMMNAYYTTGDILERYGIDPENPFLSMDTLSRMAGNFKAANQEDRKYLIDEIDIINPAIGAQKDILYSKTPLDSERISGLLDNYMTIREVMSPPVQLGAQSFKRLSNGEISFLSMPIYGLTYLKDPYDAFEGQVVPEICSIAFNKEKEVIAQPFYIIAINANCQDKETAYRFIKYILSKESQSQEYFSGLPVNRAAYAAQKEQYMTKYGSGGKGPQHAEKLLKELDDLLEGDITCTMLDLDAITILSDELSAFTGGKMSSGELAAAMDKKISEYREKPIEISEEALAQTQEQKSAEDLPVITVWYMEYDWSVKNAIRAFSEKRKDVRIESILCPASSMDEDILKMTTEIKAGEGPDIICFEQYMFNSLYKTMGSGAFCDLNELIANDDTFGNLDLNQEILDMGVYRGKRYCVPLRYGMPFLISTKGVLEDSGITISDDWTLEDMLNALKDYTARSGKQYFFDSPISFSYFLNFIGRDFIDYENSQCNFQSEEFIRLMELYKDLISYTMPADQVPQNELPSMSIKNKRFLMVINHILSPEQLQVQNSIYNAILGEDLAIYPFPTMDGNGEIPIFIMRAAAVNQKCKNKQAALDFIEELLSVNAQAAHDENLNNNITIGLPVNLEALRKDMEYLTSGDAALWSVSAATQSFPSLPLPEALAARMTQLADHAMAMPIRDNALADIINEGVVSYLEGKRTAQQAAKDIDDKVRLFLNE